MGSKQKVMAILLIAMTLGLSAYIGLQISNYYTQAKQYSDANAKPSVTCTGYIYHISNMKYEKKQLAFTVTNEDYGEYQIESITVKTNQTYTRNITVPTGISRQASLAIETLPEDFMIYPENCATHAKECKKSKMECE